MSYRRYPDRERALSQLGRSHTPPPPSELQVKLARDARTAMEAAGRAMRPFHDAMLQVAANVPALLEQSAPTAYRLAVAMRQPTRA